jgi:S1-C subfamily serine protease
MSPTLSPKDIHDKYASAVAYLAVEKPNGDQTVGSAFHIGDGVFVTARHVVENNKVLEIGITTPRYVADSKGLARIAGKPGRYTLIPPGTGVIEAAPLLHPDPSIDIALLRVSGLEPPVVYLGTHLDDWINDEAFVLATVVILGYPPIPHSDRPVLVAARAEINAIIDKYSGRSGSVKLDSQDKWIPRSNRA